MSTARHLETRLPFGQFKGLSIWIRSGTRAGSPLVETTRIVALRIKSFVVDTDALVYISSLAFWRAIVPFPSLAPI